MRILILGATGFLGSNLALRYLYQGHEIIGVDNFASSDRNSQHFASLKKHKNFSFIEQDICEDCGAVERLVWNCGEVCDAVLNFACIASPPRYQASPFETIRTSTVGVDNVLSAAFEHNCIVVHASTSEVYGDPEVTPQKEEYWGKVNSFGPRACYDEGKRCAEAYCWEYMRKGCDVRIVRIFNTYGPNMHPHDGRAVSNFINQALNDEDITIYGDGRQTRSFCYVDDLVKGIMAMVNVQKGCLTSPVNLGNPIENTIGEIAQLVLDKIPESKSKLVYKDLPADDPCRRQPDIMRAKDLLGWMPNVCLDVGLDTTIEYFRHLRK